MIPAGIIIGAFLIFTPKGRDVAGYLIKNLMTGMFAIAGDLTTELPSQLQPLVQAFKDAYTTQHNSIADVVKEPFREAATAAFNQVITPLLEGGVKAPDQWKTKASGAMADAFELGLGSFVATLAFESIFPKSLNVLNGTGPMLASLAGFAEVADAALGPALEAGIKIPATYDANQKLRPKYPDTARALELFARHIIGPDECEFLLTLNGMNPAYSDDLRAIAYRPLQPRALAQAIGDHNFDRAKITDVMKFAGLRDADIELFIDALIQRGLQPLRQGVLNETVKLAGEGLLSDSDVASTLDAQNLTDDAKNLVNQHIALLRLHTMATLTKAELVAAAKNKLITIDQLGADLSAVGYQNAEVQIIQNTVSQFLAAKELAAEARATSIEEQRLQQLTIRQAQQSYKRGEIDGAMFAAELAAAGVNPGRIAAYESLAAVQNEPTLRAGTKLSAYAQKAQSAKLAIKALTEEYRKAAIDAATVRAGLEANGMSPADVDATIAYIDAVNIKAAKAATATVPLATTNGTAPA